MSSKYNPLLKSIASTSYNFENLSPKYFIQIPFEELKVGDVVKSSTMTYSQKYMLYDGYEEYNMIKIGILLEKNEENPGASKFFQHIDKDKFVETNLFADPGSSGFVAIYKYIDHLSN